MWVTVTTSWSQLVFWHLYQCQTDKCSEYGKVWGFPGGSLVKNPTCQCWSCGKLRFDHWVGKSPWRRKWQPTPAFLRGNPGNKRAWWATIHGVSKSRTDCSNWAHGKRGACMLSLQWCRTLCDPVDCSPPGSSVYWILQARILEGIAISFSRESSRPRDRTHVSHIVEKIQTS